MQDKKNLGVRKIVEKGGSLTVTLPSEVTDLLGIQKGEDLTFVQEGPRAHKRVYIVRQQELVERDSTSDFKKSLEGAVALMGRPLTEEEKKKILEGLREKGAP